MNQEKMNQEKRLCSLIAELLKEMPQYKVQAEEFSTETSEQKRLLRSLFNLRPPIKASAEFLAQQDIYLQEETKRKGITDYKLLKPYDDGIYLWQGDITTLRCDAIVNAANSQMLGCFCPCHGCIDNAIHTFAGVQLRLACAELMNKQGQEEATGRAKITPAFNLPCKYVLHTVGPIVHSRLSNTDKEQLAACYRSCLELADKNRLQSIAFCCISTGEFRFPNDIAAELAIETVKAYKDKTNSKSEVIFNVFKDIDYEIYKKLLRTNK